MTIHRRSTKDKTHFILFAGTFCAFIFLIVRVSQFHNSHLGITFPPAVKCMDDCDTSYVFSRRIWKASYDFRFNMAKNTSLTCMAAARGVSWVSLNNSVLKKAYSQDKGIISFLLTGNSSSQWCMQKENFTVLVAVRGLCALPNYYMDIFWLSLYRSGR